MPTSDSNRCRRIVDALPLGVHLYRLDEQGRLVLSGANDAADELLGLRHQDLVGRVIEDAWPPLAGTDLPRQLLRAAREGAALGPRSLRYAGDTFEGVFELRAIPTGPGELAVLFEDVTERKLAALRLEEYGQQLQERLELRTAELQEVSDELDRASRGRRLAELAAAESRARYRELFRTLGSAVAVLRFDEASKDFVYRDANPAVLRISGRSREEVIGRPLVAVFPGVVDMGLIDVLERVRDSGAPESLSRVPYRDSGLQLWVDVRVHRLSTGEVVAVFDDTTAAQNAQAMLEETLSYLRTLFDNVSTGIVVIDRETRMILDANKAAARILGHRRPDLLGAHCQALVCQGGREDCPAVGAAKNENDECAPITCALSRPDGSEVEVIEAAVSVRMEGRDCLLTTLQDVTEQRRVERSLERVRVKQDLALEGSGIGTFDWSVTTGGLDVDARWAAMLELSLDEFEPSVESWLKLLHPSDAPKVGAHVEALLSGETDQYEAEFRCRTASGGWKWILARAQIVERDPDGQPLRVAGTHQDLTERKRAQERLQRLATAIEQAAEAVVITDPVGTIQYVNPAFETVTGYTANEAIGQNPRVLKSGHHPRSFYEEMWRTISGGDVWHGRLHNRRKDGALFQEDATISPVRDEEGRIVNYVAVKRDVTREASLEQQLQQAQRLESIGQLAAGIAHEINTPAQFIGDNLRFLQEGFDDLSRLLHKLQESLARLVGSPDAPACTQPMLAEWEAADVDFLLEELPRSLAQSVDGTARISEIVRAMKRFAHPGGGADEPIEVNEAVRAALTLARNEWKYVAEVSEELQPELPVVRGEPGALNQALLNVIVNAAQAIGADPDRPEEQMGRIRVSSRLRDSFVEVLVQDDGPGIPEELRERVFDPFFTTKEVGRGTGQGLAIAHAALAKMGGAISLESELGEGTTFLFRLPTQQ